MGHARPARFTTPNTYFFKSGRNEKVGGRKRHWRESPDGGLSPRRNVALLASRVRFAVGHLA